MVIDISKAENMRTQLKKELEDIPRGTLIQNKLRMLYAPNRLKSLGRKATTLKTKEDVFKDCVEEIRKKYPDFVPVVKGDFLKVKL